MQTKCDPLEIKYVQPVAVRLEGINSFSYIAQNCHAVLTSNHINFAVLLMVYHRWLRHLGLQIFTIIMSYSTTKARVLCFQHCKRLFSVPSPRGVCSEEQVHLFQCALVRFGIKCPDCCVLAVS